MAIRDKARFILKAAFSDPSGAAANLPFGKAENSDAKPLVDLTGYLSAMPPLPAFGPRNYEMRQRDFRIAENIDYMPGGGKYPILRAFADKWCVLRSMIDTKKDLIASMPWDIKPDPRPGETKKEATQRGASDPVVQQLKEFFCSPDGERTWFEWMKSFLEEVIVLDAGCLEMVRDSRGRIAKIVAVSGDTINRVIDDRGWTPQNEQVAYQQVLSGAGAGPEGVPQRDYTTSDILFAMRNPRPAFKWGQSSVEKIFMYALTGIYADEFIKDYYTTGNQPPGFMILNNMTPAQVQDFDQKFNAVYSGNLSTKRKIAFIPGGLGGEKSNVNYIPTKETLLKPDVYDQLVRFAAYELSVNATSLSKPMNRASAGANADQSQMEGLIPDIQWLEGIMNKIIKSPLYLGIEGYSWVPGPRREIDPVKQMQVDTGYAKNAIVSINEVRDELGKEPFKIAEADEPGVMTPNNGFIPLEIGKATTVLNARQTSNNPAQPGDGEKPPAGKPKPGVKKVAMLNSVTQDMRPCEFLKILGDTPESVTKTELDDNKVADIRRRMRAGENIPPSQLDLDAEGSVTGHDGRHRAVAAFLEGREEIPVIVTQPMSIEKSAGISPDHLHPVSEEAKKKLADRMKSILTRLRAKTIKEISDGRK